ncbi:phage protein, partial [Gottschalkia purinilytica]
MITIYDDKLNWLSMIEDYESLIFTRRFYKYGEFELEININKNNTDKLEKFNIIVLNNNFKKAGIILHKEIGLDQDGEASETLFIKGLTLDGLTTFRRIVPETNSGYVSLQGNQEAIMKGFVNNCFVNPTDVERKINLINTPNQNRGKTDKWRGSFEKLSDKLEEIGTYS